VTDFDKVMASIPSPMDFIIPMELDSADEAYVDIDTNLGDGEALLIYGVRYRFENVDPTEPLNWLGAQAADMSWGLQIHRNTDSDILLNANDSDLLIDDARHMAQATAVGFAFLDSIFKRQERTVTLSPTLRAIFRTDADYANISAATVQLAGRIYYDKVPAPSIGNTKLGQLGSL